jgi:hypothetical protein
MENGLHLLPGGWRQWLARMAARTTGIARPARALLSLFERRPLPPA